jgi:hypothetical protein
MWNIALKRRMLLKPDAKAISVIGMVVSTKLLGKEHAACLSDSDGRCSQVLPEQPPQLPLTDPKPFR